MIEPLARLGYASKAFIYAIVGLRAAAGVRGSILELAGAGRGPWLLAFIAFGLIAYAVDQALHARYGRIRSPLR